MPTNNIQAKEANNMNFNFNKNKLDNKSTDNFGELQMISKSADVSDEDFSNIVQIIDEKGNEISYTTNKFIEIFDKKGLEGFIL